MRLGLEAGARTFSFGLIYMPGAFSQTEELVELAGEAAPFGAPLVPHVRNEADGVLKAVGEMVEVTPLGAPLHLAPQSGRQPGSCRAAARASRTRRADIDITFDQYPYGAGSTVLSALLPPWAQEGGPSDTLARLADPDQRQAMQRDIERGLPAGKTCTRLAEPKA